MKYRTRIYYTEEHKTVMWDRRLVEAIRVKSEANSRSILWGFWQYSI